MGFPTKVQLIKRKASEQWYINFPAAVAQAMDFKKGETVEWFIEDKTTLILLRRESPLARLKKKPQAGSAKSSSSSSLKPKAPSGSGGRGSGPADLL